jgi:hypothetical protein
VTLLLRWVVFLAGAGLVVATLYSAMRTFVLPRAAPDLFVRAIFISLRLVLSLRLRFARTYEARDRVMALFSPIGLLLMLPGWLLLVCLGYTAMFWAVGIEPVYAAFKLSGSSLLTLGFSAADGVVLLLLEFSAAVIGLILVALLIGYLPTIYAAFARREAQVTLLEVRAGQPPSAVEMLLRFHRIHGLDQLDEVWRTWEAWFADIEESHTSLPALVFLRSPDGHHSWVTASGAVLDGGALLMSVVDWPASARPALCVRAGYLALRHIASFFGVEYNPDPHFSDPISITRAEFDAACETLAGGGVPLKPDREQAWRDFAGWRVNYDTVLLAMASITMAPVAPWSSDRSLVKRVTSLALWRR